MYSSFYFYDNNILTGLSTVNYISATSANMTRIWMLCILFQTSFKEIVFTLSELSFDSMELSVVSRSPRFLHWLFCIQYQRQAAKVILWLSECP